MELQPISRISKQFNISTRTLRYYEQIGLIKSLEIPGLTYRLYDENIILRLKQIIVLRKLRIPLKQIAEILDSGSAAVAIEAFEQNLSEIEDEINALSTIKRAIQAFIAHLNIETRELQLLDDESLLEIVDSLTVSKINFKEEKITMNVSMEELNKANETLNKQAEKNMRIVYRSPATIAEIRCQGDASAAKGNSRRVAEAIAKKFIEDANLLKLKPDMRVWGFTDGDWDYGAWTIWVTVPDDFEIPLPFMKKVFHGGLFAAFSEYGADFGKWVDESDKYEWNFTQYGTAEEYINPFNIYGFTNIDSKTTGAMEILFPIKEIGKLTDEQKEKMAKLEELPSRRTVDIDLKTVVKDDKFDIRYDNGLMIIRNDEMYGGGDLFTRENFIGPLKIEMRAKIENNSYIKLGYHHLEVNLNWAHDPKTLVIFGDGGPWSYRNCGMLPVNTFVDIEFTIGSEIMTLKIDGELRHAGNHYPYIESVKKNGFPPASVGISAWNGTVIVESLRVTEL